MLDHREGLESFDTFVPMDRRQTMVKGETLPDRAEGAVLFADISGFTPFTESLVRQFGPRRGADELIRQLNQVYDLLIAEVHRYRGSVVSFSGDAITCWFDGDDGQRAIASALAIQQVTRRAVQAAEIPSSLVASLAVKTAVTSGPVRRFLIGDPQLRYIDVLAGATVERIAEAEKLARKDEVLVGAETIAAVADKVVVAEWRGPEMMEQADLDRRFAVVDRLTVQIEAMPWPSYPPDDPFEQDPEVEGLTEEEIRPWLLAPVFERLKAGRGRFLAELRTAVALFLRFRGLEYDRDDNAGQKLDAYIRWVQTTLARYDGYLIELTIGDKGSYIYAAFGAPLAFGDDAARAVAAALELQTSPPELDFIRNVEIGLSQGRMRTGPYGSALRRTYGVQGNEVNIAARLMEQARPGQVLISKHVAEAAAKNYDFKYMGLVKVKGQQEPIPIFGVLSKRLPEPQRPSSVVKPDAVLAQLADLIETALVGQGQILRLEVGTDFEGDQPVANFIDQALRRGFQLARGRCRPHRQGGLYTPWRQILREWFGLTAEPGAGENLAEWSGRQITQLQTKIRNTNSDWLPLLPILGDLLNLSIPDNTTTAGFDPLLRQGILLALVMEIVQAQAHRQPLLLLIENAHWLDEASQELTVTLARAIGKVPVLLMLTHRPIRYEEKPLLPELRQVAYYHHFHLSGQTRAITAVGEQAPTHTSQKEGQPVRQKSNGANGKAPLIDYGLGLTQYGTDIVGRTAERDLLSDRLRALLDDNTGSVVVIEGDAGIGKTRLVADLLEQAARLGVTSLIGVGDTIEQSTPYHVWRPIFHQLFNLDTRPGADTVTRRTAVLSLLPTDPELLQLAPLLNVVLPLRLKENDVTRQMSGQARADNTHELLTHLLQAAVSQAPTLIILEDAHWLDSASWALTRLVSQRVQPVLLIIVTRPHVDQSPTEYQQLVQSPATHQLQVKALTPDEALAAVCQRLEITALPNPIATLIRTKAEGHPFFSEELAYALRDAGVIRIVDGECQIATELEELESITLPDTIEDVITSRVDRLRAPHQLTLKVASVIGQLFRLRILRDIHPIERDKPRLPDYLTTLERLDITALEKPEPDLTYLFKHTLIRDVVYNLLLFTQRQELHRAIAEWFEQTYADDLSAFYPLLAHHWGHAIRDQATDPELLTKALDYLEKAGEKALRDHANQEAARFFNEALLLAQQHMARRRATAPQDQSAVVLATPRLARWERQVGQAQLGLGNLEQSRKHLERALKLLDVPVPDRLWKSILSLVMQILRQIWHRLWPGRLQVASPEKRERLLEAAQAYERLGENYYWSNKTIPAIHAVLRTLNLAEQAGPSPELARAYANMCLVAGFISLHALARSYSYRAQMVAQSVQHDPALAWVLEISAIYAIGVGQWGRAKTLLDRAAKLSQQLKNYRRWEECSTAMGDVLNFRGKFSEGLELWSSIYESAQRRGDIQAQSWGLAGQLRGLLPLNRLDAVQARSALDRLHALLPENIGNTDEINSYSILALAYLRLGQPQQAWQSIDLAAQIISRSSPTGYGTIHGYTSVPEVYLALWEAEMIIDFSLPMSDVANLKNRKQSSEARKLKSKAGEACHALQKFARIFPIGRPSAWLWQGLYNWLTGNPARARKAWRRGLTIAQQLEMPYEQGLIHYEIGRHVPVDDPDRAEHLRRACELFTQLNATFDLERAQRALNNSMLLQPDKQQFQ